MKIIITAGGGGHFSPALAVMKKLPNETEMLFIGRMYAFEKDKTLALEYETVQDLGIPFETITTGRFQRSFTPQTLTSLAKIPLGFFQSLQILRRFKPDVIFSTGGYISVPVTCAARMLRIPVVIHEQTMQAGLANKIAGKFARKICISWESSRTYFPYDKVVLTGNPLKETFHSKKPASHNFPEPLPVLFITGGSLGSHAINLLIEGCLPQLLEKYNVYHQTGQAKEFADFERLEKRRAALSEEKQKRYFITKLIPPDEMAGIFRLAALVIGRAGINTVTEVLFFKKPALLIPLPHGQRNEQRENAKYLESVGLARVREQEDLTPETMYTEIEEVMAQLDSYTVQKELPDTLRIDATEKIITTLLSVAEASRKNTSKKT